MTRTQLTSELQSRFDRYDTDTKTLIENWINRAVKDVEKLYPFDYTKRKKTATLAADTKEYTLPTNLILHLPFKFQVQDITDADVYYHMFNVHDNFFDFWVEDDAYTGEYPVYFVQRGGTDGLVFAVFPVQNQAVTIRINGHFYTGAWTIGSGGDASENWLSKEYPDIIIEGVAALGFKHFEQYNNHQAALQTYNMYLNGNPSLGIYGLLPSERRRNFRNQSQVPRVRTLEDFPLATALRLRRRSI
jgi:hypothetical protein